jgi:hypothetical protein
VSARERCSLSWLLRASARERCCTDPNLCLRGVPKSLSTCPKLCHPNRRQSSSYSATLSYRNSVPEQILSTSDCYSPDLTFTDHRSASPNNPAARSSQRSACSLGLLYDSYLCAGRSVLSLCHDILEHLLLRREHVLSHRRTGQF